MNHLGERRLVKLGSWEGKRVTCMKAVSLTSGKLILFGKFVAPRVLLPAASSAGRILAGEAGRSWADPGLRGQAGRPACCASYP